VWTKPEVRKQAVTLVSGAPFERFIWRTYNACRSCIPAAALPPAAARARAYDRMTVEIARRALSGSGNSIDVGAHYGSILKELVRISPAGSHWAFEPIPHLARQLHKGFPAVMVCQLALSDYTGSTEFRFLPGSPAYSSLIARPQVEAGQLVRSLRVLVRQLDDCIPEQVPIAFIKIDVEGAEPEVLRGAAGLLRRDHPVVVFESAPARVAECADTLAGAGLHLWFLADYLAGRRRELPELLTTGRERGEYYYVASKD
jgi:FkbM family methyltransferase